MKSTIAPKIIAKTAAFAIVGGVLGFLYYVLFGEADGDSFLSATPFLPVIYFAFLGILLSVFLSEMKKSRNKDTKEQPK